MGVIRRSAFSGAHYLDCKADKKVNMEKLKCNRIHSAGHCTHHNFYSVHAFIKAFQ